MEFDKNRVFLSGVIVGMVLVFLVSQPFVMQGIVEFKSLLYRYLPDSVSSFLWDQTLTALTFFWAMIFVGFGIWVVRGDFFAREDHNSDRPRHGPSGPNGDRYDEF